MSVLEAAQQHEIWRPVQGYEKLYEVSNRGRVRCLDKTCRRVSRSGKVFSVVMKGKILSPNTLGRYDLVGLTKSGKKKTVTVHSLVSTAFLGPTPNGYEINHNDGNKKNNAATNFEHMTSSQNRQHAYDTGLQKAARGEAAGPAKLTETEVIEIRLLYRQKPNQTQLAKQFGVTRTAIKKIVTHETWAHVADDMSNGIGSMCGY